MLSELEIRKKLGKQNFIALLLIQPGDYQKANLSIIKYFTNIKKIPGVYLSVNRPYKVMKDVFDKHGINSEMLIFIDAVTNLADADEEGENCFYLESPENLSDMSIAISQALEAIHYKEKFIIIDSLSTLLVYNSVETVVKFIHFVIGKMRASGVTGVLLGLKKKGEAGVMAEIGQFCDVTLDA